MLKLIVGLALVTLVACSQCPNNEFCEAGQTCCQDPTGEFCCCPFHHGECCEDHMHCCPEGMLCGVVDFTCINATHTLPLVKRIPTKLTDLSKSFRMIPSLPVSEDDITCPDGSFCPAEFSCLLMTSSYGCCPVAEGFVCSDGKHCCPKYHECSANSSSCVKQKGQVETVLCGDGKSECPVDTTCCETEDGQWSCCPMPRAVCCDDKIHCCPEGSVCDVEGSKCMSSTNQELPMWDKFPARLRAEWEDHKHSDVPCNDTASCEDGTTCCKTKDGGWACCPLPEAVCCDDFIHCCPHGTKCNVAAGTCDDPSGSSVPWLEKVPVQQVISQNRIDVQNSDVPCDDTASCEDGTTCCKTQTGGWACCPLPEAVCCDDFIHCCPHGTKCNVAAGTCDDPSGSSVPWLEKVPVQQVISQNRIDVQNSDVPCDDTASCEDGTTCCKTQTGGWACCPLPEAVCCDDFIHCCPHGKKCNVAAGTCDDPSGSSVPWLEKVPVKPVVSQNGIDTKNSDVPCDDHASCEDGTTCCKTQTGGWACCPLPEAVCCDDFIHCCPHGKKCNVAAGTCEGTSGSSVPWLEKVPVKPVISQNGIDTKNSDVPCDDTASCEDGTTCCKTQTGGWACCPLPEAVCCDDFIHCCPHGKKCNVAAGKCYDPSGSSVPWLKKVPVQPVVSQNVAVKQVYSDVPCDDHASCEDGTTCCKTQTGGWACCPLPEAVCCDDFIHCCPHGKKCNVAAGTCDDPSGSSVPWLEKVPVKPVISQNGIDTKNSDVPCDDTASCEDGTTCCKTQTGGWACCPLPEAVCCDDFIHCCPHGKKCNVAAGKCYDPSGSSVPWLKKVPVQPVISQNVAVKQVYSDVPCDDHASCEDGTTCCKTQTGGWACCPLPEAVCCDDFIHCCPHGKKCNVAAGTCDDPSGSSVPWLEKVPVQPVISQNGIDTKNSDVPCDDTASCEDGTTCCKTQTGGWACCPLPEAVCCDDFIHCCPHGKKCNVAAGTCDDPSGSCVPWLEKVPTRPRADQRSTENVNCDSSHVCPESNTCCKNVDGDWGCCPLPEAVCCWDKFHCCPRGTTCDVVTLTCNSNTTSVPMSDIIPASDKEEQRQYEEVKEEVGKYEIRVPCDAHTSCPDHTTCCLVKNNKWGCCPQSEAVCCSNQEHCCPKGYKCDLLGRSCIKTSWLYVERVTLVHIGVQDPQLRDIQCGGGYSCQDGQTCCPTSKTSWGCCPYSMAKCCDDMKHCCPAGDQCGEGGICTPAVGFDWNNWDNWRVFFSKKKRAATL